MSGKWIQISKRRRGAMLAPWWDVTERMKVPGGYLIRTRIGNAAQRAVGLTFMPDMSRLHETWDEGVDEEE